MGRSAGTAGTGTERDRASHWLEAARLWQFLGPPLRPAAEDVGFLKDAVREWTAAQAAPPRVLLLGVTPEIYGLPWPEGTDFLAADRTQAMIDVVWPGPRDAARHTD